MSRTIYTVQLPFDKFRFSADLAEASAQIRVVGTADDTDEDWGTQYQTADARHRETDAARLALRACGREYFAAPGDDRSDDEILDELLDGVAVSS